MPEKKKDLAKYHLMEELAHVQEVQFGARSLTYVNAPPTMRITEVTATNANAAERLLANFYASIYPDLFDGFDPAEMPSPSDEELKYTEGGPFGSINDI